MRSTCDADGGDPPCWAHLLDGEREPGDGPAESPLEVADLHDLASSALAPGVAWSRQSEDLNVNLVVLGAHEGVDAHVNAEVDVLIVVLSGDGVLVVDDLRRPIRAGQAVVIPRGTSRMLRGSGQGISYLTCHRRRAGLWPAPRVVPPPISGG